MHNYMYIYIIISCNHILRLIQLLVFDNLRIKDIIAITHNIRIKCIFTNGINVIEKKGKSIYRMRGFNRVLMTLTCNHRAYKYGQFI